MEQQTPRTTTAAGRELQLLPANPESPRTHQGTLQRAGGQLARAQRHPLPAELPLMPSLSHQLPFWHWKPVIPTAPSAAVALQEHLCPDQLLLPGTAPAICPESDQGQGQPSPPWPPQPPCCCPNLLPGGVLLSPSSCMLTLQPQRVKTHRKYSSSAASKDIVQMPVYGSGQRMCCWGGLGGINMGKQLNTDITTPKIFCLVLQSNFIFVSKWTYFKAHGATIVPKGYDLPKTFQGAFWSCHELHPLHKPASCG